MEKRVEGYFIPIDMCEAGEGDKRNWLVFSEGQVAMNPEECRSRPWLAHLGMRLLVLSYFYMGNLGNRRCGLEGG